VNFEFLNDPAGFGLSEGWLQVAFSSPYWQILLAGLFNTLKVALPALFFSTVLGLFIGSPTAHREAETAKAHRG